MRDKIREKKNEHSHKTSVFYTFYFNFNDRFCVEVLKRSCQEQYYTRYLQCKNDSEKKSFSACPQATIIYLTLHYNLSSLIQGFHLIYLWQFSFSFIDYKIVHNNRKIDSST